MSSTDRKQALERLFGIGCDINLQIKLLISCPRILYGRGGYLIQPLYTIGWQWTVLVKLIIRIPFLR